MSERLPQTKNLSKSGKIRGSKTTCLNVFYQNVRGLKTKLKSWRNSLALTEHNLVAVTESFLDGSVEDSELISEEWTVLRRDRKTPCGGVLLAARTPIVLRRLTTLETDSGEDLWASFDWQGRNIYVGVIYMHPRADESDYMRWFCKVESFINNIKGLVIILGDLNLNSSSHTICNYYCYFMSYCNLSEKNDVVNSNGGLLDVVLVQERVGLREVRVQSVEGFVKPDLYHPPLDIGFMLDTVRYSLQIEPSNIDSNRDWNFSKCDLNLLFDLLAETSWDDVLLSDDVQSSADKFYDIIYNLFDMTTPKKHRKNNLSRRYPVWFTNDIIQDIKRKLKFHKLWRFSRSDKSYQAFSDLRASLKKRITAAHDSYLKDMEDNISANPRGFWQHVSSLRSKGGFEPCVTYNGESFNGVQASEAFAQFFSSVFLPDVPQLDAERINEADKSRSSRYINILRVKPQDVASGIKSLKPSRSVGPDCIPPWFLKQGLNFLVQPLCHIFNIALTAGIYPTQWKLSRVTPIPKSTNKQPVEEYRPIAILSTPAKVFERIIHKEVYRQAEQYLASEQHGFRKKRSVDTNLLEVTDFISACLDRGSQVDVLYFDFRKAFDRINNDILLTKLNDIGFAPGLLRFTADYLKGRQQFVRLGVYDSSPYYTGSGVSQGSIYGPLLFVFMINDLPDVIKYSKCLLYADDLKLFIEVKSEEDCLKLQRDVEAVDAWSVANQMELNPLKCHAMTFSRRLHPIQYKYQLDSHEIARSTTIKDLGVTFDRKLTFNDHIAAVAKESYRRLGFVMRNSKDFQGTYVIRLLFEALVRSKLEASSCVWNPHEQTYTTMLEKVQKSFLRCLYKRNYGYYPYMYPTNFLLGCLGYNSLEVRRECNQMVVMCKVLHNKIDAPNLLDKLSRLFVPDPDSCPRRGIHPLFSVPPGRTIAHGHSPIQHTLAAFNRLLARTPECDVLADDWNCVLSMCLAYCEEKARKVKDVEDEESENDFLY